MNVLVTGARGFLGSRLVAALAAAGHAVTGIDQGDALPTDPCDVFVHLAWRGVKGPARADYALQLTAVREALDAYQVACRLGCTRFVVPGTIGERMAEHPECRALKSANAVYTQAKATLHRLLRILETPACPVVWARLGNIYGGGDAGNILGWTLTRLRAGEMATFGPADQPYDFIHVTDAIAALAALATAPKLAHDAYYVGAGRPRPLKEYLLQLGACLGREDLIGIGRRPDDGTRYLAAWFSIDDLKSDTGFAPKVGFAEGLFAK